MRSFVLSLALLMSANVLFAWPSCPQGHCSLVNAEMNQFCIESGMAGRPYLVVGPNGNCLCPCSCVIAGTKIATDKDEIAIEMLDMEDRVLLPLSAEGAGGIEVLMHSDITEGRAVSITLANDRTLTVSENHTFVDTNYQVIKADELKKGSKILDQFQKPIDVLNADPIANFEGSLYNVTTSMADEEIKDHVIVTEGVLSGDYLTQITNDSVKVGVDVRFDLIRGL